MRMLFAAMIASALTLPPTVASAGTSIRFRLVSHNVGFVTMDAGDGVEGHVIGAAKFSGIVTREDGTSGIVTYISDIDYVKGGGTYVLYETLKFPDGAVRLRARGLAKPNGTRTELPDGKFDILGGDGAYAGATGTGEYNAVRIAPFADGGDTIEDGVMHLN